MCVNGHLTWSTSLEAKFNPCFVSPRALCVARRLPLRELAHVDKQGIAQQEPGTRPRTQTHHDKLTNSQGVHAISLFEK